MAKRSSKSKRSAGKTSKRSTAKRASPGGISLGGIHKAMQSFVDRVDKSQRTEPHLIAARDRIYEMLLNMPRCLASNDPQCNVANPPPECKFAPIPK